MIITIHCAHALSLSTTILCVIYASNWPYLLLKDYSNASMLLSSIILSLHHFHSIHNGWLCQSRCTEAINIIVWASWWSTENHLLSFSHWTHCAVENMLMYMEYSNFFVTEIQKSQPQNADFCPSSSCQWSNISDSIKKMHTHNKYWNMDKLQSIIGADLGLFPSYCCYWA